MPCLALHIRVKRGSSGREEAGSALVEPDAGLESNEKGFRMLALTRKPGQTIVTSNGVTFTVIKSGKGKVRVGVEAPADVVIRRGELLPLDAASVERKAAPGPLTEAVRQSKGKAGARTRQRRKCD